MFTAANVFGILRSLFRLLARRRPKGATRSETTAVTVTAGTPEGRPVVRAGFNMQAEIPKLAGRIVEPLAAKLVPQRLEPVLERIPGPLQPFAQPRTTAH